MYTILDIIKGDTLNKVYDILEQFTIEQIKEARDVHGHKILIDLGKDAYRLFIYQCNYAMAKKYFTGDVGEEDGLVEVSAGEWISKQNINECWCNSVPVDGIECHDSWCPKNTRS